MYKKIRNKFLEIVDKKSIGSEEIKVVAGTLTSEEAIGNPEDMDYPILKGKERLMQAEFKGALGQAFTDMFGDFTGSLSQVIRMKLSNNFRRAIFVATVNAVMRHLEMVEKTIHCRDQDPIRCAGELAVYIQKKFRNPKIALAGLQPRMLEALSGQFEVRATDLDEENIGKRKFGVMIDSPEKTEENLKWCDVALVTGTTLINDTINSFMKQKPVIFFGVSIAGPAHLLGFSHFCPYGR